MELLRLLRVEDETWACCSLWHGNMKWLLCNNIDWLRLLPNRRPDAYLLISFSCYSVLKTKTQIFELKACAWPEQKTTLNAARVCVCVCVCSQTGRDPSSLTCWQNEEQRFTFGYPCSNFLTTGRQQSWMRGVSWCVCVGGCWHQLDLMAKHRIHLKPSKRFAFC